MTIRLISAASIVALLTACSDQASAPAARPALAAVEQGQSAYLAGNYAVAEEAYRAALSSEPGNAAAMLGLGEVLEQTGRTSEAIDYYKRASNSGSGDIRVWSRITQNNLQGTQDGVTESAWRHLGSLSHGSYQQPVSAGYQDIQPPAAYNPILTDPVGYEVQPTYTIESETTYHSSQPDTYYPDPQVVNPPVYQPQSPVLYSTPVPAPAPAYGAAPAYTPMPSVAPAYQPSGYDTGHSAPAPSAYEYVPATPVPYEPAPMYQPTPSYDPAPAYQPMPVYDPAPAYQQPTQFEYQPSYQPQTQSSTYQPISQSSYPRPKPSPYTGVPNAVPVASDGYYEYDLDAVRKGATSTSNNSVFATPMPKRAPAATALPSGYAIVNGVVEYVGDGSASTGLAPATQTTTTYETMPSSYGTPVDVVPSGLPSNTPSNYSAPRGVDVQGGYEYGVDPNGLITIE